MRSLLSIAFALVVMAVGSGAAANYIDCAMMEATGVFADDEFGELARRQIGESASDYHYAVAEIARAGDLMTGPLVTEWLIELNSGLGKCASDNPDFVGRLAWRFCSSGDHETDLAVIGRVMEALMVHCGIERSEHMELDE